METVTNIKKIMIRNNVWNLWTADAICESTISNQK